MGKIRKNAGSGGRIAEAVLFAVFLVMAVAIVSGWIYRSVSGSGWYLERQAKEAFRELAGKVKDTENIAYIRIDRLGSEAQTVYDVPEKLFGDLDCDGYAQVTEEARRREIFASDAVEIVYRDDSSSIFHVTEEGEVYWDYLEVDCPSLAEWYLSYTER